MARRGSLIRAGTTVEDMVRAVADSIVTGALAPGEKLDETGLASRFEVSRTPVREALRQLSAMGLVDHRPNRGAIVALLPQQELAALFESMAELEAICARFSALRMGAAERDRLAEGHAASRAMVDAGAEEAYEAWNSDFHSLLYAGAGNPHIRDLASLTRSRLAPFRRAQFRLAGRLARSWAEHDAIVAAILARDAEAAARTARAHVSEVSAASAVFAGPEPAA